MDDELLHFALPGLLPEGHTLAVDRKRCIVSLLYVEAGTASIRTQVHFFSNGIVVLVPLLQAYPDYCPHEVLLSRLFPRLSLQRCGEMIHEEGEEREVFLRPLRRAKENLAPGLRQLGLDVYSVRGIGYLLKAHIR